MGQKNFPPGDSNQKKERKKNSLLFAGVIAEKRIKRDREDLLESIPDNRPNKFNFPLLWTFSRLLLSTLLFHILSLSTVCSVREKERKKKKRERRGIVYERILPSPGRRMPALRIPFPRQYFHISSFRWPCLFSPLPILKPLERAATHPLSFLARLFHVFPNREGRGYYRFLTVPSRTHPLQMLRFLWETNPKYFPGMERWTNGYRFEIGGNSFLR